MFGEKARVSINIFWVLIIGFRFLVLLCGLWVFKLANEIVVCAESASALALI